MVKKLVLSIFLLVFSINSFATHLMGGEITWDCLGNGQYIFTMKVYRDCNGVAFNTVGQQLDVHNNPFVLSIQMSILVSVTDISPKCNGLGPTIFCPPNNGMGGGQGAVQEIILQSPPVTLPGTPPAQGWIFSWQNCCRNNMAGGGNGNMLYNYNAGQVADGMALRAKMFNYQNKLADPCFDSSPMFAERPSPIICGSQYYAYNHNAFDKELDSLRYYWDEPLNNYAGVWAAGNPPPIAYWPGYSMAVPLPSTLQNINNIPAVLDPVTGQISFTSYTIGNFVTVVRVDAYKCGTLVAQIFREIQVTILPCGLNTAPDVLPPFQNAQGQYTDYCDTVNVGSLVTFDIKAVDLEWLPTGAKQTISLNASGGMFGAGFVNPNAGCLHPPCATLNAPPPNSGQDSIVTTFTWQVTCDHIALNEECPANLNTYTFNIETKDDYCPAPQQNITTICITVIPLPYMPSPDLRCVSVLPNGDITLTWITPPDPGNNFNSYHVYATTNPAGPYTLIDSIFNYNQTSYTHVGAGGNAGTIYYFVKSRSGCNGKVKNYPIDTLQSIFLNVQNLANIATLNWNPLHTPANLPSTLLPYRIFKEYPAGVWNQVATTNNLFWSEPINLCSIQINYRVEISDASGCISSSNIDGDIFADVTPPAIPALDSVTVNPATGIASISWITNNTDTDGYIIYKLISGVWTPIDTVYGMNTSTYVNLNSTAGNGSEEYCVAAFDSCFNVGGKSILHNTIYLQDTIDLCDGGSHLSWNKYVNWAGGVSKYDVYTSTNGGPFTFVTTVPGTDTMATHGPLTQFSNYCYFVRAWNQGGTKSSTSNQVCKIANLPAQPVFNYLRYVTVEDVNKVEVAFYVDINAGSSLYKVMRSLDLNGVYVELGQIAPNGSATLLFTDLTAETGVRSYYYKIIAVDNCGADGMISNQGRTIYLTARAEADLTNILNWNDYELWLGSVQKYHIYRSLDGGVTFNTSPIASITYGQETTYKDDISGNIAKDGIYCYYIQGVEGAGNVYLFVDSSKSNIACAQQDPSLFIPNAFTPGGKNPIFRPENVFVNVEGYSFVIFDRWGEKIFETSDPKGGWDGTFKGDKCQMDVYVYLLRYKGLGKKVINKRGTVTLVK